MQVSRDFLYVDKELTRVRPSYFDQRLQPRGGCITPPWILVFPTEWFCEILMGIVSGSKNPMVIVKIFYIYHVTLKLKVIDLVHGYGATP